MAYDHNPVSQGKEQEAQTFEAILDYTVEFKGSRVLSQKRNTSSFSLTPPHQDDSTPRKPRGKLSQDIPYSTSINVKPLY